MHLKETQGITIQEFRRRKSSISKKLLSCDKAIAQLNKGYKSIAQFIGFRKNGIKWNELINQLRYKAFDFQPLSDLAAKNKQAKQMEARSWLAFITVKIVIYIAIKNVTERTH